MIVAFFIGVQAAKYLGPDKFVLLSYAQIFVALFSVIPILGLDFINQRRRNAKLFYQLFKDNSRFVIQQEIDESSRFGFSLIINDKINRAEIIQILT